MKIKFLLLIIFVLVLFLTGYFFWFRQDAPPEVNRIDTENPVIVAFGDSLIEGQGSTPGKDLASQLSLRLNERVINFGVGGSTSAQGLTRLPTVLREEPDIVILLFGGNDFLQRVPAEVTFGNLRAMINTLQSSGAVVVLLGIQGGIFQDHYARGFETLAEETGSVYVSNVLEDLLGNDKYMSDAVHPNDEGYALIADRVEAAVKQILKN